MGLICARTSAAEQLKSTASHEGRGPAICLSIRPSRLVLVLNLKAAKALDVSILPSILLRAHEAIDWAQLTTGVLHVLRAVIGTQGASSPSQQSRQL